MSNFIIPDFVDPDCIDTEVVLIKSEPVVDDILNEDEDYDDVIEDYSVDFEEKYDINCGPSENFNEAIYTHSEPIVSIAQKSTPNFKCRRCPKKFRNEKFFQKHVYNCQGYQKPQEIFICDLCTREFPIKSRLKIHMTTIHLGQYAYECECGKKFWAKSLFEIHTRTHLAPDDRPFACANCTKRFKTTTELDKHTYRVHISAEEKPCYGCDECEFTTSVFESMEKHKLTHLPDILKPFHCQYCSKGFSSKSNKDHHEMIHTNAKPYPCDDKDCDKSFKTNAEMKEHYIRQHTDFAPFVCEICNDAMKDRFRYRRHMTRHEKEMGVKLDKSVRKFNVRLDNLCNQ